MNLKSDAPGEMRSTLSLDWHQVCEWFHSHGGKEYSPKEKPLDTDGHKILRLDWVKRWWNLLTCKEAFVGHLDEKWFYITSRRKKIKRLPLGPNKIPGVEFTPSPKMRSRRFPVKAMFVAVVANPNPDRDFDGKIFIIERICQSKITKQMTHPSRFTDDLILNNQIKNGDWRNVIVLDDSTIVREFIVIIGLHYRLEDKVIDRIVFYYKTFVGNNGNDKNVYLEEYGTLGNHRHRITPHNDIPSVPVTIADILIAVRTNIMVKRF